MVCIASCAPHRVIAAPCRPASGSQSKLTAARSRWPLRSAAAATGGSAGARRSSRRNDSSSRLYSSSNDAELEEIDPMTGELIGGTSLLIEASERVQAGGLTWAYRHCRADPAAAAAGGPKVPVLCLHGLGSSSYSYRNTLRLLGEAGHEAYAVDWVGHGASSKPDANSSGGGFDYSADAYIAALGECVKALGLAGAPLAVVVQGYVLGQCGLLWALENEDDVSKLVILNTPLGLKTPLRPELAAYKNPLAFLRPRAGARFDAANYNAAGGPYAMSFRDAEAYDAPYESDPAASAAVAATMESLDYAALLRRVDEGYWQWRNPSLLVYGTKDQFVDMKSIFDWLDSKRTTMRLATNLEAKLGHMPQEDFAEGIHEPIAAFLAEA